jgi:hypothetical protein
VNEYVVATTLFAIPIVGMIAGVVITWIKAKHGLLETSAQLTKKLETELAARDAVIADQAERLKVLERIVTDSPTQLEREIRRLGT